MPDVSLDLSSLVGGGVNDPVPVKSAFQTLQNAINALDGDNLSDTTAEQVGVSSASGVRRGKSIIATSETRTNTAYGLMTTPDRVRNVVLPTDGLIYVAYQATWQESVGNTARAAIFIGGNQMVAASPSAAGGLVQAAATGQTAAAAVDVPLASFTGGLTSCINPSGAGSTDATTGEAIGFANAQGYVVHGAGVPQAIAGQVPSGPVTIFAAAGTYDISVQFKSSSGSVTAKNRKLWVWTVGF